jgi:hypothetical protein
MHCPKMRGSLRGAIDQITIGVNVSAMASIMRGVIVPAPHANTAPSYIVKEPCSGIVEVDSRLDEDPRGLVICCFDVKSLFRVL